MASRFSRCNADATKAPRAAWACLGAAELKKPARASGREFRSGRHIEREDRDGVADAENGDGDGDGAFAELREGAGRAALVGRDAYDVRVAAAPLNVPRGVDGGREYGHADGLRIAGPVIVGVHGELAAATRILNSPITVVPSASYRGIALSSNSTPSSTCSIVILLLSSKSVRFM